jgi:hypothetical protein
MSNIENAPQAHERADEKPHKHYVSITINGKTFEVHPGPTGVEHLKHVAGMCRDEALEEEKHGRLHRLPDDGAVEIHGGEVFIAKPKLVDIKINDVVRKTHPGENAVAHLRKIGEVPADEVLSEFKHGAFVDLADNAHVET